ncbi:MAG TPA: Holliday junction branch migration protein RuvA [Tepidisphaeraceae bacterium]|jgi:Holliday junction DNA helicase RuvA|nr:Holliday junction branch migration protein RuvA [Tepidisphaeraceae bacterium]
MISSLTGELQRVDEDRIHLKAGAIVYELLVPAADLAELRANRGEELTLHTIFYLAGDISRGGAEPTLIGFIRVDDKRFFNKFTTVKGIGVKTALRALTVPVGEIAQAIESRDVKFLVSLDGIGKRTAELMVAELAGKVGEFAAPMTATVRSSQPSFARRPPVEEDAIGALMQLGERRIDAEHLLDRAKQANPRLAAADVMVREALRMRTTRA